MSNIWTVVSVTNTADATQVGQQVHVLASIRWIDDKFDNMNHFLVGQISLQQQKLVGQATRSRFRIVYEGTHYHPDGQQDGVFGSLSLPCGVGGWDIESTPVKSQNSRAFVINVRFPDINHGQGLRQVQITVPRNRSSAPLATLFEQGLTFAMVESV